MTKYKEGNNRPTSVNLESLAIHSKAGNKCNTPRQHGHSTKPEGGDTSVCSIHQPFQRESIFNVTPA